MLKDMLIIDRTTAFDPTTFIGAGWSIVEQDGRSLELAEIDLTKVQFVTILKKKKGDAPVSGEDKLKHLIASGVIRLDAKVFQTFWENQHRIPEHWKQPTNNIPTFIFFEGTILRNPNGNRCVLYLFWFHYKWIWYEYHLDNPWCGDSPSAVLAS